MPKNHESHDYEALQQGVFNIGVSVSDAVSVIENFSKQIAYLAGKAQEQSCEAIFSEESNEIVNSVNRVINKLPVKKKEPEATNKVEVHKVKPRKVKL